MRCRRLFQCSLASRQHRTHVNLDFFWIHARYRLLNLQILLPIRKMFPIRHPHFLPRNPAVTTLVTKQMLYHYLIYNFLAWMVVAQFSVHIKGLCHLFDYYPYIILLFLSTFFPADDMLQTFIVSCARRAVHISTLDVHPTGALA